MACQQTCQLATIEEKWAEHLQDIYSKGRGRRRAAFRVYQWYAEVKTFIKPIWCEKPWWELGFWIFWASPGLMSCVLLSALWFPQELNRGEEKGHWEEGGGGWRKPIPMSKGVWQWCGANGQLPLAWAAWDTFPIVLIPTILNRFQYPCLECRRYFFQTVVYIYKQGENMEDADAGLSQPQLTSDNSYPTQESGGGKTPTVIPIFLHDSLLKNSSYSPPPSAIVLHHPAPPSPAVLQHVWLFLVQICRLVRLPRSVRLVISDSPLQPETTETDGGFPGMGKFSSLCCHS